MPPPPGGRGSGPAPGSAGRSTPARPPGQSPGMPSSSRYLATVRRAVGQPASSSIRHNCWSERGWALSSSSRKRRSKSWVLPPETVTNRRRGSQRLSGPEGQAGPVGGPGRRGLIPAEKAFAPWTVLPGPTVSVRVPVSPALLETMISAVPSGLERHLHLGLFYPLMVLLGQQSPQHIKLGGLS